MRLQKTLKYIRGKSEAVAKSWVDFWEHNMWLISEGPRLGAQLVDTVSKYDQYKDIEEGTGVPTVVIPGFSTTNSSTYFMRKVLNDRDHRTIKWCQPRNNGFSQEVLERSIIQVKALADGSGHKVNVTGHSLGGCIARMVANEIPDYVNIVATLGSPINSIELVHDNSISKYDTVVGQVGAAVLQYEEFYELFNKNPPVPTTSLYSKSDGVVHWTNSVIPESDMSENIEVESGHFGMGFDLFTAEVIANRLAQMHHSWEKWEKKQ